MIVKCKDCDRTERMRIANEIIRVISEHGRKFFFHNGQMSHFEIDLATNRLWFRDGYSQKRIYVAYRRGRWNHFSEGGTLRSLVENLADYITKKAPIRSHFGPWPEWVCEGDLWGYGDSMQAVRDEILKIRNERSEVSGPGPKRTLPEVSEV